MRFGPQKIIFGYFEEIFIKKIEKKIFPKISKKKLAILKFLNPDPVIWFDWTNTFFFLAFPGVVEIFRKFCYKKKSRNFIEKFFFRILIEIIGGF